MADAPTTLVPLTSASPLASAPPPAPAVTASDVVETVVLGTGALSGVAVAALTAIVGSYVGGLVGALTFVAGVGLGAPVSLFCGRLLGQQARAAAARAWLDVRVRTTPPVAAAGAFIDVVIECGRTVASPIVVRLVRKSIYGRDPMVIAVADDDGAARLRVPSDARASTKAVGWAVEAEVDAPPFGRVTIEAPFEVIAPRT